MTETATETQNETTTAAPAASEGQSKVQRERGIHGPESAVQLIGHLGKPKADVSAAIYVEPREKSDGNMSHGYVWTTLAVNRGEGFPPSWLFLNIYPTANEAGERPSPEDMQALAAQLTSGRRVKVQGPLEIRDNGSYEVTGDDGSPKTIRDTSVTVKLFYKGSSDCVTDEGVDANKNNPANGAGARPITFLPRIGNDSAGPDLGF